ncbi:hypothetical protein O9992_02135 [Vibrio lentus]|nr:hypothetical protein [Vibrio lentus]
MRKSDNQKQQLNNAVVNASIPRRNTKEFPCLCKCVFDSMENMDEYTNKLDDRRTDLIKT